MPLLILFLSIASGAESVLRGVSGRVVSGSLLGILYVGLGISQHLVCKQLEGG
jgi:hypothetical protein